MEWITVGRSDGEKKPSSVCQTRDSGFFIIDADGKVSGLMADVRQPTKLLRSAKQAMWELARRPQWKWALRPFIRRKQGR